jgi:RNA polymerase sigma-70 factor, ECF subfamily
MKDASSGHMGDGHDQPMTFEDIYRAHAPFVWRTLRRLGVRESDVPDATQEVFLVVHRKLADFEGRSTMKKWLFGIAIKVAAGRRRLAHVRKEALDDAVVDGHADERVDVAAAAESRDLVRHAEVVLRTLPLEQCAVFVLFELEGLSGDEIAEMVDAPVPTVHSRLRLARATFREAMARRIAPPSARLSHTGGGP